ncbi:hypothetical protein EVG20_g10702, partial [Dentipellis fragilis]
LSYSASTRSSHYSGVSHPYPYPQQQQYQTTADRRSSYASSYAPGPQSYLSPQPIPEYQQSYYSQSPPAPYPPYQQPYSQPYPNNHAAPSVHSHSHSHSITSNPHAHGIVAPIPQPEEPPDASLDALQRAGLTPAQAYQAQVYQTTPAGPRPPFNNYNGRPDVPRLGVNIDADNGRLGLDFAEDSNSSSPSDESASELPWARSPHSHSSPAPRKAGEMLTSPALSVAYTHQHPHYPNAYGYQQPSPSLHPHSSRHSVSPMLGPQDARSIRSATSDQSSNYVPYPNPSPHASPPPPPSYNGTTRPYPLQLNTAMMHQQPRASPSSSTVTHTTSEMTSGSSAVVPTTAATTTSRRSSESSRTVPINMPAMNSAVAGGSLRVRDRTSQDRARSMSAATGATHIRAALLNDQHQQLHYHDSTPSPSSRHRPSLPPLPHSPTASPRPRRTPIVYPALLSRVAAAFRARITLADRVKDGLTYTAAFDGRQAVDKLAYIIKTTDRNLALLLGRALDAQKWFHAVTYDHRLRDNAGDLYQFRTGVVSPFVSAETVQVHVQGDAARDKALPVRPGSAVTHNSESPSNEPSTESDGKDAAPRESPSAPAPA